MIGGAIGAGGGGGAYPVGGISGLGAISGGAVEEEGGPPKGAPPPAPTGGRGPIAYGVYGVVGGPTGADGGATGVPERAGAVDRACVPVGTALPTAPVTPRVTVCCIFCTFCVTRLIDCWTCWSSIERTISELCLCCAIIHLADVPKTHVPIRLRLRPLFRRGLVPLS